MNWVAAAHCSAIVNRRAELTDRPPSHRPQFHLHDKGRWLSPPPSAPPFLYSLGVMTDQELIFAALRQVGSIVAEHLELGTRDGDEAIKQLVAVLDTPELAAAMNRVERGHGCGF
jgi:hypothetical protein